MIKIVELTADNYENYLEQIYELSEGIKEYNSTHNKEGQFFGASKGVIASFAEDKDTKAFVALDVNEADETQAKVAGYCFVDVEVPQNTNSDYTKYFHTTIDYKNNLANNFSDINEYNTYVTKAYLEKLLIFASAAKEITDNPQKNANGYDIATFIQKQVENDTFYENNFLRREINNGMYRRYASLDKVSDFAQIFYYSIADVDKELLVKMYAETGQEESLDTLIANYELFLKYQQPNFIEKEQFNLEEYFDVEMKNSTEINTYAVNPEYRGKGLPKILLFESLKALFNEYFQKEENSEVYLVSTVHNENKNSQNVLGSFGITDYLYVERMKGQNRRVYINKVSREEFLEFLYDVAVELLIDYNYYSDNFGIDMISVQNRIDKKIEDYQSKIDLSDDNKQKQYYEKKMASLLQLRTSIQQVTR